MEKANFDTTYCINDKCDKNCSRHADHYEFEVGKGYSWQYACEEYLERYYKGEVWNDGKRKDTKKTILPRP